KVQTKRTRTSQPKQETKPISKPKQGLQPKTKPTVKVQEKQPFRLTETPSPVYGLGKPNQKEIIEFELSSTPIIDTESIANAWKEAHEEVAPTILINEQVEPK